MIKFSVLLSLYAKEKPAYLKKSLESVFYQSRIPDEVVLVEDGPLTDSLCEVLEYFILNYPILKIIKSDKNQGLGKALNLGLYACSYDYVARMDTDDICYPDRFEKQLDFLERHPEVDMVGSWTQEFTESEEGEPHYMALKKFPESNVDIYFFARKRNPFEHPSVIFKKQAVIDAGSYQHCYLFEDYFMWARMMLNNCVFYNIPEPLLYFRMTTDSFERRGGFKYALKEIANLWKFKQIGFFCYFEFLTNVIRRFPVRIMPNKFRKYFYNKILRKY